MSGASFLPPTWLALSSRSKSHFGPSGKIITTSVLHCSLIRAVSNLPLLPVVPPIWTTSGRTDSHHYCFLTWGTVVKWPQFRLSNSLITDLPTWRMCLLYLAFAFTFWEDILKTVNLVGPKTVHSTLFSKSWYVSQLVSHSVPNCNREKNQLFPLTPPLHTLLFLFLQRPASLQASCMQLAVVNLKNVHKGKKTIGATVYAMIGLLLVHLARLSWKHRITVCTFHSLWAVHAHVWDICHSIPFDSPAVQRLHFCSQSSWISCCLFVSET